LNPLNSVRSDLHDTCQYDDILEVKDLKHGVASVSACETTFYISLPAECLN